MTDRREFLLGSIAAVSGVAGVSDLAPGLLAPPLQFVNHAQDEIPWMNLPRELREWNWGGGSCVHASTVMELRWQGQFELANLWRRKYSGGESSSGLRGKLDREGVPYSFTGRGDDSFLQYCSDRRLGAVIFYYPSHSICFCGFSTRDGQSFALLLDNNRIDQFIEVPRDTFVDHWRGYGGFALATLFEPPPRLPYDPYKQLATLRSKLEARP